ncbi:protein TonB [Campylobacter sputorum subsp. bubulus]|uniref:Putative membrane protein insertion efficiency factor n=1 Tax=Campylobacter sputorum subsp. sputorum TaxID=32024 RepID=A0A381DIW9_9BACT|nr:membrane protein insertion efficiency factor YidD [Campylobacter sputorum]ASM35508.1 membrane protein insertion efficiency factor, YidD family [Campylobacter sputorum aubsp. sputorum RM3237]ASM37223.1 membrane protein insertion efficiency factor, YidD family [Campylobacter sputorum bv. faecalis CCUG 20703]ASM38889.1 membrane protein insertion efficiency factor, YidD family [Campylobacter sputorum bv. paraureolyticus LMG 11764]KAB0582758.1 membrane protein insertion efficiency factor YidD [Ca
MNHIFIYFIKFYQKWISPIFPKTCRYYPTCSEYAYLEFKYNFFLIALINTILRILRCNQLFKGGFDHPIIKKEIKNVSIIIRNNKNNFKFWLVPYKKNKFYIIKNFKNTKEK